MGKKQTEEMNQAEIQVLMKICESLSKEMALPEDTQIVRSMIKNSKEAMEKKFRMDTKYFDFLDRMLTRVEKGSYR